MRTSLEIKKAFERKGCAVEITHLTQSHRDGGEILIAAPGVSLQSEHGFSFQLADIQAYDPIANDTHGRWFKVWLVFPGDYLPATPAEFVEASEEKRMRFGTHEAPKYFVHKDELKMTEFSELASTFELLGI